MRSGDGAGEHELVARPPPPDAGADRSDRRPGLGPEPRPHGHADPGLGRAYHLLSVPEGMAENQQQDGQGPARPVARRHLRRHFRRPDYGHFRYNAAAAAAAVHQTQVWRFIVQTCAPQIVLFRHVAVVRRPYRSDINLF